VSLGSLACNRCRRSSMPALRAPQTIAAAIPVPALCSMQTPPKINSSQYAHFFDFLHLLRPKVPRVRPASFVDWHEKQRGGFDAALASANSQQLASRVLSEP
jgi:hypothetical protein